LVIKTSLQEMVFDYRHRSDIKDVQCDSKVQPTSYPVGAREF